MRDVRTTATVYIPRFYYCTSFLIRGWSWDLLSEELAVWDFSERIQKSEQMLRSWLPSANKPTDYQVNLANKKRQYLPTIVSLDTIKYVRLQFTV